MDAIKQLVEMGRSIVQTINDTRKLIKIDDKCPLEENINFNGILEYIKKYAEHMIRHGKFTLHVAQSFVQDPRNITEEQYNHMMLLLDELEKTMPVLVKDRLDHFTKLTSPQSSIIDYDYSQRTTNAAKNNFRNNLIKLYNIEKIDTIDVISVTNTDTDKIGDIRNILELNVDERTLLEIYFARTSGKNNTSVTDLTMLDLSFNPKRRIQYSDQVVKLLTIRQLQVESVQDFYKWVNDVSNVIIKALHTEREKNEQFLKNMTEVRDDRLKTSTVTRRTGARLMEIIDENERQLKAIDNSIKKLNDETNRYTYLNKYLGDEKRIENTFFTSEINFIKNIVNRIRVTTASVPTLNEEIVGKIPSSDYEKIVEISYEYSAFRARIYSLYAMLKDMRKKKNLTI